MGWQRMLVVTATAAVRKANGSMAGRMRWHVGHRLAPH